MSEMTFTPAQQDAIQAMGGSIIVSAAAGSGKTRVLVQRVIRLLTDPEAPVDADKLLIVTFTRAAADEMRSRIAAAIDDLLVENPDQPALRRQQLLLANADICTIHSFCSKMLRENFYALDINQDFRIASEGESNLLRQRILSDLIEERYASGDSTFRLMSEILSGARSDRELEKTILAVYDHCSAHPFPSLWLDKVSEYYRPDIPIAQTIFAGSAFRTLGTSLDYLQEFVRKAEEVIDQNPAFTTSAKTCGRNKLDYLTRFLERLTEAAAAGSWTEISDCITSFEKYSYRKPTAKKDPPTDEECRIVKDHFDRFDQMVEKQLMPLFGITEEIYQRDTQQLYPVVTCLCDVLKEFDKRFLDAKKERGILDFSDLEHLFLNLLTEQREGRILPSPFAEMLSAQYEHIMVDEYQDTNETQESIFCFLSRQENNLFVVGDIKQSIYRFREAMPEIFKNRRQHSELYRRDHPSFPAKIILDRNFRSSEGVIDSINYVFRSIMSEQVGEITYNEEEQLVVGADYPDSDEAETEIHLLTEKEAERTEGSSDADDSDLMEQSRHEKEAAYIASQIRNMVSEKRPVTEKGRTRPVRFSDIAILMRFISSNGQVYVDALNQLGIPAYIDKPYSLFDCYEVNVAVSFLKMIDNPLQDIPVLALLLCPVYGFTADELAELKSGYQGKFLFQKLSACARDKDSPDSSLKEKCQALFRLFTELRTLSVTVGTERLLSEFFERTGFIAVFSAMENGGIRVKNLRKLLSYVRDFESGGRTEVAEFVRHLLFLEENGKEISVADTAPADAVRVMSIHHSKGLEFPVCFLADLSSLGNRIKDEVLYHPDFGFGLKSIDRDHMLKFNTLQRNVIGLYQNREEKSEAMRVLYVAMTRAKEKLIAVISLRSDPVKKLQKLSGLLDVEDGRISPYALESTETFADWLLLCALAHPRMGNLRSFGEVENVPLIPTHAKWRFVLGKIGDQLTPEPVEPSENTEIDQELYDLLTMRFSQEYPMEQRTRIPTKVAASLLVHQELQLYHIAESRPAFMQEHNMTGAEKGTAMHTFLQYVDFAKLPSGEEEERQRLVDGAFLTAEQAAAIRPEDIIRFTGSRIFAHIRNADQVLREYRFTVNIDASDVDPSYTCEDKVILQGAMDCLIFEPDGIVIVDYKTDRVKQVKELENRYRRQLQLYRKAAVQLFDLPVKACMIYSVCLGEEIVLSE